MLNSQYLRWFHGIEKTLWSFFSLFGDLCSRCANMTLDEVASNRRAQRDNWCCCMIDNQVHDNWEALNAIQERFNRNWYEPLRRQDRPRMPGNGPCPALGPHGRLLKKYRPITCTTQFCTKMLAVLHRLGIVKNRAQSALQIEDLIKLPDILPTLYGSDRRRSIQQTDVDAYITAVRALTARLAAIPERDRIAAIDTILPKQS